MAFGNVIDGAAVRNDVAAKAPLAAQDVRHQPLVRTTGLAIRAVVGAHHGSRMSLDDSRAKRRQVGLSQISLSRPGVKAVAFRFGSAVYGVVLGRGGNFQIARVIALQAFDESDS